jgi:hypothetical protein
MKHVGLARTSFVAMLGVLVLFPSRESSAQLLVDFGDWRATTGFDGARTSHAGFLMNNRLYILGGLSYSSKLTLYDDVQTAVLGNDGLIAAGSWRRVGSLPTPRSGLGAAFDAGKVYLVGGYSDSGTLDDSYYATVQADGSISGWTRSATPLNTPRSNHALQVFRAPSGSRYLVVIAGVGTVGNDTVHFDTVEVAALAPDGSVGVWRTCPYHLKGGRSAPATLIANGYIYVFGGWGDLLVEDVFRDVQFAPLREDGCPDPWRTSAQPLNMPLYGATAALTAVSGSPFAVVLGGNAGQGNYFNNVQLALLSKDGSVGPWTFDTHQFAIPRWGHVSVVYNSFLYVIGGAQRGGSGYLDDVQVSALTSKPKQ